MKYKNNVDIGDAYVVIEGQGNYIGTFEQKFTIAARSMNDCDMILSQNTFDYSGEENKPSVTVKDNGVVLEENTDYTVSYKNNINAGKATVIVSGKGIYAGTVEKTFTIKALSLEKYDVTLSQDTFDYTGKENKTNVTVKNGDVMLKEGTDYTVTYKNNVNAGQATLTIQGTGNYAGTIEKTLTIKAISLADFDMTLSKDTFNYTGKENKPSVTVKNGDVVLKAGTDYTVKYENNVQVGTAKVTVTGIGNYKDTIEKTFTIKEKVVVSTPNNSDIHVNVDDSMDQLDGSQIDLSRETKMTIQESAIHYLKKYYAKEFNALAEGAKIDVNVSLKSLDHKTLTNTQKESIRKALRNGTSVLDYYDISVLANCYTKDGKMIS